MKKLLALLLVAVLCFGFAFSETDDEDETAGNTEVLWGYGYINPNIGYYIALPKAWGVMGSGTKNNDSLYDNTIDILGLSEVASVLDKITPENDVLICLNEKKTQGMILTYGSSEYIDNDALIKREDDFKAKIKASAGPNVSVTFLDDTGKYAFQHSGNSSMTINLLRLHYTVGDSDTKLDQYFLIDAGRLYIFTFMNVPTEISEILPVDERFSVDMLLSLLMTDVYEYNDEYRNIVMIDPQKNS